MIELTHIPSEDEVMGDRSTVVGRFAYPPRDQFRGGEGFDEGAWSDACADVETQAREETATALNDHGIDTTDAEIRLSELEPGEIRVYW